MTVDGCTRSRTAFVHWGGDWLAARFAIAARRKHFNYTIVIGDPVSNRASTGNRSNKNSLVGVSPRTALVGASCGSMPCIVSSICCMASSTMDWVDIGDGGSLGCLRNPWITLCKPWICILRDNPWISCAIHGSCVSKGTKYKFADNAWIVLRKQLIALFACRSSPRINYRSQQWRM